MKFIKPLALILTLLISAGNTPGSKGNDLTLASENARIDIFCSEVFNTLGGIASKPDFEVFKKAMTGFLNLKAENKIRKNILTIIDFSISSRFDRMWVIDLSKKEVVDNTLVAHGKNSGDEFASKFSNIPGSCQSSLGFYLGGEIFYSQHGMSLFLDGVEQGINDKARERGIILHGADYVSKDFINKYGLAGRSFGCPAVPMKDHEKIVTMLAGGSCIYIYSPDQNYMNKSKMLKEETALQGISLLLDEMPDMFETDPFFRSGNMNGL